MAVNRIHTFDFDALSTHPTLPGEQVVVRTRAGVDGVQTQHIGEWGQPWDCEALFFPATFADASLALFQQQALRKLGAVCVIFENVNIAQAYGIKYFIKRVELLEMTAIGVSAGTIVNNPGAMLKTRIIAQPTKVI